MWEELCNSSHCFGNLIVTFSHFFEISSNEEIIADATSITRAASGDINSPIPIINL